MTFRPYGFSEHERELWLDEQRRIAEEHQLCERHLEDLPCWCGEGR